MGGEGWSCFQQLPSGLIDRRSATLSLNWLRPRPTLAGFKLRESDVDAARYRRLVALQRWSLIAVAVLIPSWFALAAIDLAFSVGVMTDDALRPAAVFAGVASVSMAGLSLAATAFALLRYQQAEPRRQAFAAACEEFERIDEWRAARCVSAFWDGGVSEAAFEHEAAELLAGYFRTGQVMLTRPVNDYGVDVLICSPEGRAVAQCKPWVAKVGAAQIRALAGAKAYFEAKRAVMVSIVGPSDDGGEARDVATRLGIDMWDVPRIVAIASALREGSAHQ
jgi:hypothetical protein